MSCLMSKWPALGGFVQATITSENWDADSLIAAGPDAPNIKTNQRRPLHSTTYVNISHQFYADESLNDESRWRVNQSHG